MDDARLSRRRFLRLAGAAGAAAFLAASGRPDARARRAARLASRASALGHRPRPAPVPPCGDRGRPVGRPAARPEHPRRRWPDRVDPPHRRRGGPRAVHGPDRHRGPRSDGRSRPRGCPRARRHPRRHPLRVPVRPRTGAPARVRRAQRRGQLEGGRPVAARRRQPGRRGSRGGCAPAAGPRPRRARSLERPCGPTRGPGGRRLARETRRDPARRRGLDAGPASRRCASPADRRCRPREARTSSSPPAGRRGPRRRSDRSWTRCGPGSPGRGSRPMSATSRGPGPRSPAASTRSSTAIASMPRSPARCAARARTWSPR